MPRPSPNTYPLFKFAPWRTGPVRPVHLGHLLGLYSPETGKGTVTGLAAAEVTATELRGLKRRPVLQDFTFAAPPPSAAGEPVTRVMLYTHGISTEEALSDVAGLLYQGEDGGAAQLLRVKADNWYPSGVSSTQEVTLPTPVTVKAIRDANALHAQYLKATDRRVPAAEFAAKLRKNKYAAARHDAKTATDLPKSLVLNPARMGESGVASRWDVGGLAGVRYNVRSTGVRGSVEALQYRLAALRREGAVNYFARHQCEAEAADASPRLDLGKIAWNISASARRSQWHKVLPGDLVVPGLGKAWGGLGEDTLLPPPPFVHDLSYAGRSVLTAVDPALVKLVTTREEAELYSLCDVVLPEAVLAAGEQSEYAAGGDEAGEGAFPGVVPERAVRVLERLSATLGCGPGAVRFSRFRPLMLPPAAPTLRAAADGRQLIPPHVAAFCPSPRLLSRFADTALPEEGAHNIHLTFELPHDTSYATVLDQLYIKSEVF